jgi:hypothetical protein
MKWRPSLIAAVVVVAVILLAAVLLSRQEKDTGSTAAPVNATADDVIAPEKKFDTPAETDEDNNIGELRVDDEQYNYNDQGSLNGD